MALPTTSVIQTAVQNVFNALAAMPSLRQKAKFGASKLGELEAVLMQVYLPRVTFTLVNAADASLTAALLPAGSIGVAFATVGISAPGIGEIFQVNGTGDTTGTGLATAKGGAPAAGDRFQVTSASAVLYIGVAPDFTSYEPKNI